MLDLLDAAKGARYNELFAMQEVESRKRFAGIRKRKQTWLYQEIERYRPC